MKNKNRTKLHKIERSPDFVKFDNHDTQGVRISVNILARFNTKTENTLELLCMILTIVINFPMFFVGRTT